MSVNVFDLEYQFIINNLAHLFPSIRIINYIANSDIIEIQFEIRKSVIDITLCLLSKKFKLNYSYIDSNNEYDNLNSDHHLGQYTKLSKNKINYIIENIIHLLNPNMKQINKGKSIALFDSSPYTNNIFGLCYYELLNTIFDNNILSFGINYDELTKIIVKNNNEINSSLSDFYDMEQIISDYDVFDIDALFKNNDIINKMFLFNLLYYINNFELNKFNVCYNCESKFTFSMPRISVCGSDLCLFQMDKYGMGVELPSYNIIDLILNITYANLSNKRLRLISLSNDDKDILTRINEVTYNKMCRFDINQHSLQNYAYVDYGSIDSNYNQEIEEHKNMMIKYIKLTKQIYSQIRAALVYIGKETKHNYEFDVYDILAHSEEKEKEFREKKFIYGTIKAYHGSAYGNWLSILINGLKNYSGTANQINGAAYGPGIYCADNFNISMSYSKCGNTRLYEQQSYIVAEVEIIKADDINNDPYNLNSGVHFINSNNPYIRVIDESLISIRKLYVKR